MTAMPSAGGFAILLVVVAVPNLVAALVARYGDRSVAGAVGALALFCNYITVPPIWRWIS